MRSPDFKTTIQILLTKDYPGSGKYIFASFNRLLWLFVLIRSLNAATWEMTPVDFHPALNLKAFPAQYPKHPHTMFRILHPGKENPPVLSCSTSATVPGQVADGIKQ
jgi:hypothetical protein